MNRSKGEFRVTIDGVPNTLRYAYSNGVDVQYNTEGYESAFSFPIGKSPHTWPVNTPVTTNGVVFVIVEITFENYRDFSNDEIKNLPVDFYENLTDEQLLHMYHDLTLGKPVRPVPMKLVSEVNKRKLVKSYKGTFNTDKI